MEFFDGGAGGFELGLGGGQCAEGRGLEGGVAAQAHTSEVFALGAEACDYDSGGREELVGGVPDEIDGVVDEGDAAEDVVLGLPETRGFPGDL